MIERQKERSAFLQCAKPIETHRIEPFEEVAIFTVQWWMTVLLDKALDFFEPGDDTSLAGRSAALFLGLGEVVEFGAQLVQVEVTHSAPRP